MAAGMTGGLAYILDDDDTLIPKVSFLSDITFSPFRFWNIIKSIVII